MNTDTIIQMRPLMPGGELIYVQTPQQGGVLEVQEEDSWDLAEDKANQEQDLQGVAPAVVDAESSSTSSSSDIISDRSSDSSSDSASISTGSAPAGSVSTTATAGTARATGTAASGANRMTAAVPANASLRVRLRASVHAYHFCACVSGVLLIAGTVFTLMANKVIQHRDSGYVYPEEIEFDKVMAGIWYGLGAISGGIGIAYAVHHYRRGNN